VLALLQFCGCGGVQIASLQVVLAPDMLPADRQVGSWRRSGKTREMSFRDVETALGPLLAARGKFWKRIRSLEQHYVLGLTGRKVVVQVYDFNLPAAAFDLFSTMRQQALANGARVTRVGGQGLVFPPGKTDQALLLWSDRFLVQIRHLGLEGSESALLAFGRVLGAASGKPYELTEVYALQIPGEVVNSGRFMPGGVLGRRELPGGVEVRWRDGQQRAILFASAFPNPQRARRAFNSLSKAAAAAVDRSYAHGLAVGKLSDQPVAFFLWGRAVLGLSGKLPDKKRLQVLESIRLRCAGSNR
jgi:hypothetical protein